MDIAPELLAKVQKAFADKMAADKKIGRLQNRIRDGTASLIDAHEYAERYGELLSRSYLEVLTAENLPNANLYYNIADRVATPTLLEGHAKVSEVCAEIQKVADEAAGIGLQTVTPGFPAERVKGLIGKIADAETLEGARKWLDEPIINNLEAFVDDFVRDNAKVRAEAGMKTTITRRLMPGCCEWCAAIGGTYDYGEEPPDVYKRHEYCRCRVVFKSDKEVQDVWAAKGQWSTPEELDARRRARAPGR